METAYNFHSSLEELERAAHIISTGSNQFSVQDRQVAEANILKFRKSRDSFHLCKYIIEHSNSEFLLYETSQILRDNLIWSWPKIKSTEAANTLAQELINLLFNSPKISYSIGRRLSSIVALIVKHKALEGNGEERTVLINHLMSLLKNPGRSFFISTIITESILAEHQFVSSGIERDPILTYNLHFKAKKEFEESDLLKILEFCLEFLDSYQSGHEGELERILSILEIILSWYFTNANLPQRVAIIVESDLNQAFKPPNSWERVVCNPAFERILFSTHFKLRQSDKFCSKTIQILGQLIGMSGPLFVNRQSRLEILNRVLPHFTSVVQMPDKVGSEVLGISDIVRKVLLFHRMTTLNYLDPLIFQNFLNQIGEFTNDVIRKNAIEESDSDCEDRIYRDSLTRLLEAWTNILTESYSVEFPPLILNIAYSVFETYLNAHLSPPLGFRAQVNDSVAEENEEPDEVVFLDQLQAIGVFGRSVIEHSMNLLNSLLAQLYSEFVRMGPQGLSENHFEDLHWVLLVAGHVFTYEAHGETNLIPKEIVEFTIRKNDSGPISSTLFKNVGNFEIIPDPNADPFVRFVSKVVTMCEFERRVMISNTNITLSPELSKNLLWFLNRWASLYYFYPEQNYAKMSPSFSESWSKKSFASVPTLNLLLARIRDHLKKSGEDEVQLEAVRLLRNLSNSESKALRALESPELVPLIELLNSVSGGGHYVMSCEIYQNALSSLLSLGHHAEEEICAKYWDSLLIPLFNRLASFSSLHSTSRHDEGVKLELAYILSGLIGVASSLSSRVALDLFLRLRPLLHGNIQSLLSAFSNYSSIVTLAIQFLTELGRFLSYLSQEHSMEVYRGVLDVISAYVSHASGRISGERTAEEESYEDLVLLLELLTSLLAKDFIDLSSDERSENDMTGAQVVIFGLCKILPLINQKLLEYPVLSEKYYRLILYLSELEPDKILGIQTDLFELLLTTVSNGLLTSSAQTFNFAADFITCLANQISRNSQQNNVSSNLIKPFLPMFLRISLSLTVGKDTIPSISSALFALISAFKEFYSEVINEIVLSDIIHESHREHLKSCFEQLTAGNLNFNLGGDRVSRISFKEKFEVFIQNARPSLIT